MSDGRRLENLTWRLWTRETNLSLGRRPRPDPSSTGAPSLAFEPAPVVSLSDPEAGTSSDDDDDDDVASLSSVDDPASRNRYLSDASAGPGRASSADTSVPSEDELGAGDLRGKTPSGTFLQLLPSTSRGPGPVSQGTASCSSAAPQPSHLGQPSKQRGRAPSARSLPPMMPLSPSILPPPRPNALTPLGMATIIQTMIPMDFAAEHAKARCLALSDEVRKLGVKDGGGEVKGSVPMVKSTSGSSNETPSPSSKSWTAPEPGILSQLASADATPIGTPVKQQHLKGPRIVNIAPTPPKSLASSEENSPETEPPMNRPEPVAEDPAASTGSNGRPTIASAVASSSSATSAPAPLRPALTKRSSGQKTVRISPPHQRPSPAAMERKSSSGSARSGSVKNRSGASLSASTSSNKAGKTRVRAGGPASVSAAASVSDRPSRSGSGLYPDSLMGRWNDSSGSLVMKDSLEPEHAPPLRTIRGFTPGTSSSTAADSASSASPTAVPATPANSQASSAFPEAQSEASSAGYPAGFPHAPPPTPARQGAPLPTTMSAKSTREGDQPRQVQQQQAAQQRQRANFFLPEKGDTDDEASLSPKSSKSASSFHAARRQIDNAIASPIIPPPPPPSLQNTQPSAPEVPATTKRSPPVANPEGSAVRPVIPEEPAEAEEEEEEDDEDGDYETESDESDEWGSEYTDSEAEEEAREADRKARQAAFQKELFAKHAVQRNIQTEEGGGVKRAGLSMLFHPELRGDSMPTRNQSAVELRPPPQRAPMRSNKTLSLKSDTNGAGPSGTDRPASNFPRPQTLLQTKSSVALPVLAQQEPKLTRISPTSRGAQGSSVRPSRLGAQPPTTNGPPAAPAATAPLRRAGSAGPGAATGVPPAARQPSRLGARPADTEFSDDDDSDDEEAAPSAEQDERLAAVAARQMVPPTTRPEPIAPPLSPRTTRRNMIANEMTESVRRNLLWERQMRAYAMGIGAPGRQQPVRRDDDDAQENEFITRGFHEAGW